MGSYSSCKGHPCKSFGLRKTYPILLSQFLKTTSCPRDSQFPIDLAAARALGKRLVEKAMTHT